MSKAIRRKLLAGLIPVLLFGFTAGYFLWYISFEQPAHRYRLDFSGATWITTGHRTPDGYFVRELFLHQRVADAWVALAATDNASLYINGKKISSDSFAAADVSAIHDITGSLHPGKNVIAVAVKRTSYPGPPALLLKAGYAGRGGGVHQLVSDTDWKVSATERSRASDTIPWDQALYDHSGWPCAIRVGTSHGSLPIYTSTAAPYIIGRPIRGNWIWCRQGGGNARTAYFRKTLYLGGIAKDAYIGISGVVDYQLAVNNVPVAGNSSYSRKLNIYDITGTLHAGRNVIIVSAHALDTGQGLFANASPAGLLVDGMATDGRNVAELASGPSWQASSGPLPLKPFYKKALWTGPEVLGRYPSEEWGLLPKAAANTDLPLSFLVTRWYRFALCVLGVTAAITGVWLLIPALLSLLTGRQLHDLMFVDGFFHVPPFLFLLFIYLVRFDIGHDISYPFQPEFLLASVAGLFLLRAACLFSIVPGFIAETFFGQARAGKGVVRE